MRIPASSPSLNEDDFNALHKAIDDGMLTEWRMCAKFSKTFSEYVNQKHTILVNSGSSANFIAIRSLLDLHPGKLILTTATAFPTTVAPIYQHGCIPVYIDIDPDTLSPNIGQLDYMIDRYGHSICGAIFTHTLGFPYDEPLVKEILGDRWLIADSCDALGSSVRGLPVGTWADASTHSFFPAHHICGGQAGAITTNNSELAKIANQYIRWGRDCLCLPGQDNVCGKRFEQGFESLPDRWDHKYTFTKLGYNMQITEPSGALLYSQLMRINLFVDARNNNFSALKYGLRDFRGYLRFTSTPEWSSPSPFGFPIIVRNKIKNLTGDLIAHLEANGVATRRMFGGNLTRQPAFENLSYVKAPDLEGSDKIMNQGFWIGCHPNITDENIDWIVKVFEEFFDERNLY